MTLNETNAVREILRLDKERNAAIRAPFNPITGQGSILMEDRAVFEIGQFPIKMWLPKRMFKIPLIKKLLKYGSLSKFIIEELEEEDTEDAR